jgi:hypothetical protein
MNLKRKIKRAKLPKTPHHCGTPMLYKDSYKVWICQKCGKVKGADNECLERNDDGRPQDREQFGKTEQLNGKE